MPKSTNTKSDAITMDLNDDTFSQFGGTFSVDALEMENLKKGLTTHKNQKQNQSAIMLRPKNGIETSMMSSYYPKRNRTFNLSREEEMNRVKKIFERAQDEQVIQEYISVPNIYKILTRHKEDGVKQKSQISQSKGYWEWLKKQRGNKSISEYKKKNELSTMALRAQYLEELMAGTFKPTDPNEFDKEIQNSINQYVRRHHTKQNSLYGTTSLSSSSLQRS